ncbi:4156_t:CDS:2 [Gigaspora margarita]|uniref:4156_t:CDS:1 n=1 Tax=Gigaspora margarita TaxID=4874 RepID=A0ABN7UG95_GIGMA|nr:4156_t:CDS:2 [Gigaspora margarita]
MASQDFYNDVEYLARILYPVNEAIKHVEYQSTTLADIYIKLVQLASVIHHIPTRTEYSELRNICVQIYNRRWDEFDFEIFKLGYFFHPKYRAGLQIGGFRIIAKAAINIWKSLGGGNKSAEVLLTHMKNYCEFMKPYNDRWDDETDTLINVAMISLIICHV